MICHCCRVDHHEDCKGGTWCCCQHRTEPRSVVRRIELGPFEIKAEQEPNGNR